MGAIGGGPTFVGTVVGHGFTSEAAVTFDDIRFTRERLGELRDGS